LACARSWSAELVRHGVAILVKHQPAEREGPTHELGDVLVRPADVSREQELLTIGEVHEHELTARWMAWRGEQRDARGERRRPVAFERLDLAICAGASRLSLAALSLSWASVSISLGASASKSGAL
jgi:hypothetical protein